jgi:hypothetical protein
MIANANCHPTRFRGKMSQIAIHLVSMRHLKYEAMSKALVILISFG